jgi:hypothetical protein
MTLVLTIRYSYEDQLGWRSTAIQKDVTGIPSGERCAHTSEDTISKCLIVCPLRITLHSLLIQVLALDIITAKVLNDLLRLSSNLIDQSNPLRQMFSSRFLP